MRKRAITKHVSLLVLGVVFSNCAWSECADPRFDVERIKNEGATVEGPLDVAAVENEHTIQIEVGGIEQQLPFGFGNEHWLAVKSRLSSTVGLYLIRTADEMQLQRASGEIVAYGAVKHGCVVDLIMAIKKWPK
jgi:hypothetical protein